VIVFIGKHKNRWQFQERGVYFSLDKEELREMYRLLGEILYSLDEEKGRDPSLRSG
jgi:hypothetical protein